MSIKAVLFDLDGTLLPMDQDAFVKIYSKSLAAYMAPYGYQPEEMVRTLWQGVRMMMKNDGSRTNEKAFWDYFVSAHGEKILEDMALIDKYYRTEFVQAKAVCSCNPKAREVIDLVHESGRMAVLATNPFFPAIATENRICWAGLLPSDFVVYTTYEHCSHCKPNLKYYEEVLEKIGCVPEECIMVGNDVQEDMIAARLGMKVFLLKDCILNTLQEDISTYPQGSFAELKSYLEEELAC